MDKRGHVIFTLNLALNVLNLLHKTAPKHLFHKPVYLSFQQRNRISSYFFISWMRFWRISELLAKNDPKFSNLKSLECFFKYQHGATIIKFELVFHAKTTQNFFKATRLVGVKFEKYITFGGTR